MSSLHQTAVDYLRTRRSFGYELANADRTLNSFLDFMVEQGEQQVTLSTVMKWKKFQKTTASNAWAVKYRCIRGFTEWLNHMDDKHQVLPANIFKEKTRRARPHIFTDEEIKELIKAASQLKSKRGLRCRTLPTFIALLVVTGLRVLEAINLNDDDVNTVDAYILIRGTKGGGSRIIPLDETSCDALQTYRKFKNKKYPKSSIPFFIGENGRRPSYDFVRCNIYRAMNNIGMRQFRADRTIGKGPRIHDFRHTFAVKTMINWYKKGQNPDNEITKLSNFLGHTHIRYTYWYLEAVPELLIFAFRKK